MGQHTVLQIELIVMGKMCKLSSLYNSKMKFNQVIAYLFTITMVTTWGCTEEPNDDQSNLSIKYADDYDHIDLTKSSDSILPISSIIEVINIVDLDGLTDAVGNVSRVIHAKDQHIFILGDYKNAQVSILSEEGKHVKSINAIGKGPGEWLSIQSIDYDRISNSIVILSNDGSRMNFYSTEGVWKYDKNLPFFAHDMSSVTKESSYVFYMGYSRNEYTQNYNCLLTDNGLNLIERYLPYVDTYDGPTGQKYHLQNGFTVPVNDEVLMNEPFVDTVFSLDLKSKEVSIKYTFFFGDRSVPDEFKGNLDYIMSGKVLENAFLMNALYHNDEVFIFSIFWDRRIRNWIWDRNSKRLLTEQSLDEPLLSELFLHPVGKTSDDECIAAIYPHQVIPSLNEDGSRWHEVAMVASKYIEANFPLLHEKILGLEENSNPLLVTYRLNIR